MQISRQDLYERVWQEPMRTLAPNFGISDVALRKICLKAEIPVPERGYWAKLQAGKTTTKIELPTRPPGMPTIVHIGESRYYWRTHTDEEFLGPIPDPPHFAEPIEDVEKRVCQAVGKVRLIKSFDAAHHAISRLLKADDVRRQKQAASRWPSSWDDPLFDGPFEIRRLRILNALFLATTKFGGKASVSGRDGRDITISVHGTNVHLGLDLPNNLKKNTRYEQLTKGDARSKLKLVIKGAWDEKEPHVWEDSDQDRIEDHLSEIVIKVIVSAEVQLRAQAAHHHNWWLGRRATILEQRRQAYEEAERKRRAEMERRRRARIDELTGHAMALHQADATRALVERARAELAPNEEAAFERWSHWALKVADDLDPIRSGRLRPTVAEDEAE